MKSRGQGLQGPHRLGAVRHTGVEGQLPPYGNESGGLTANLSQLRALRGLVNSEVVSCLSEGRCSGFYSLYPLFPPPNDTVLCF